MKRPVGLPRHTTTPGHYPAFAAVLFAAALAGWSSAANTPLWVGTMGFGDVYLEVSMLGVFVVVYVAWLLLVLRRWITAATGGGLSVAAYALALRFLARGADGVLPYWGRIQMGEEPVYRLLDAAYGFGTIAFVTGIAFVVASSIAERLQRRDAPDWAVPE